MGELIDTWGTNGKVSSLAVSPDGRHLAAAIESKVQIWNIHTGEVVLHPLTKSRDLVNCVVFSSDGLQFASSSDDQTICIWDSQTGSAKFKPLTGHINSVTSVMFSHDDRLLVSGSWDHTIRLWDTRTGRAEGTLIGAGSLVNSVAISLDGSIVLGGLADKTIKAYDTATHRMLFQCIGHMNRVRSVALSPDGLCIASGSDDCSVRIWDASTGKAIGNPLEGRTRSICTVAFSPDGRYIASGSFDETIRVWDVETGAPQMGPLHEHRNQVLAVVFTPDGRSLVSGSSDKTIKIWGVQSLGIQPQALNADALSLTSRHLDAEITSTTTSEQILQLLGAHGCANVTHDLDLAACGQYPFSAGGFGDIFRGRLKGGTEVAIKTLRPYTGSGEHDPKYLKHAARELYVWSKCRHVNVQPLLGLAMFRGQIGMVATWESNGNLPQYLQRNALVDRCKLSIYIADGLSYLHASGVIHGDLKGGNVLISKNGIPQLADFGSAVLREYTLQFTKTSAKETLSTQWAAPELFSGGPPSAPADIYALGMTILEAITGDHPWAGMSELAVMFAVIGKGAIPKRPMDHIPTDSNDGDALWLLLQQCWAYEPEKRPTAEGVRRVMKLITQSGLQSRGPLKV